MKKIICVTLLLVLTIFAMFGLCACGEEPTPEPTPTPTPSPENPDVPEPEPTDPTKETFSELSLEDKSFVYDGNEHEITVSGNVPDGASVVYENNKATNAGTYNVKATISKENYNTLVLSAKLIINKADFVGLSITDKTVTYDGNEHEITVSGNVPDGASVVYENNKATNAGTYNVKATISKENYNTLVLSAKLIINKADFVGLSITDKTVTYNGNEHEITVSGNVPDGASVVYENNKATNAGTYNVKATISKENYNTKILRATLKINKANIVDGLLSMSDSKVEYDGLSHSICIVGDVPSGCTVSYTYNNVSCDSVTDSGEYNVVAVVGGSNYNNRTYTATLTISTTQKKLYSAMLGDTVYFQNPLDSDKLYMYAGSTLSKVNNDEANYLTVSNSTLYYTNKGLFSSNIKSLSSSTDASEIYSANAEYTTIYNGYIYFAVNGLFGGDQNGIYRYSLSSKQTDDIMATQIYCGNASWLCIYNDTIYFANGSSKGDLYSLPITGGTATQITSDMLTDRNVTEMTISGNCLFLNIGSLTKGYALHRIDLSTNTITKMSTDAGKNLVVAGNYLYYINSDLLTSNVFGKGVYRILTSASGSLPGDKLVDENVYSLTGNESYLFYYRDANKHLVRYNISDKSTQDVMADFVPVDNTYVMGYAETKEYNGEIYYINNRDGGAIYKYNPATKSNFKVISQACSDFWFNDGYMWYSKYVLTNYDLYKLELKTGAEPVRVSKNRIDALTFDGDYIYYIDNGGTANRLRKVPKTSSDYDTDSTQITNNNLNYQSLTVLDGIAYYCTDGDQCFYSASNDIAKTKTGTSTKNYGQTFTYLNGKFYIYNHKKNTLYCYDLTTKETTNLASDVQIVDIVNDGTNVFYASITSGSEGLYKLTISTGKIEKVHEGAVNGLGSTSMGITFMEVNITFVSEMPLAGGVTGTGYLYVYNGKTVECLNK